MSKKKKLEDGLNRLFSSPPQADKTETPIHTSQPDSTGSAGNSSIQVDPSPTVLIDPEPTPEIPEISHQQAETPEKDKPGEGETSQPVQRVTIPESKEIPAPDSAVVDQNKTVEITVQDKNPANDLTKNTNHFNEFADEQVVIFMLGDQLFGINISSVESIIKISAITEIPRAPDYMKGVTNLRGRVVPVFSLCQRLGIPEKDATRNSRIIIVNINELDAGMIVDEVKSVTQVLGKNMSLPSDIISVDSAYVRSIANIDNDLVILLELEEVFIFQFGNTR